MNILEIIQEANNRLSLPKVTDAFNDSNENSINFLASANKMARDIAERYEWSNLIISDSFDTVIGEDAYDLPSDYKEMVTYYLWNSTRQWAIEIETSDRAVGYKATGGTSWTTVGFRIILDQFKFTVPADSADVIKYDYKTDYISKLIEDEVTTFRNSFEKNTSTFLLEDEVLIKGIVADISRKYGYSDAAVMKQEYGIRLSRF